MINIFFGVYIFLHMLLYLIIIDIIMSWLSLLGVNFRFAFISDIIEPMYGFIRKYIPTRIGILELSPMILIFGIYFFMGIIESMYPQVVVMMQNLFNLI